MQSKGILIASLVLLALAGGIYWSNKAEKEKADQPAEGTVKLLSIPEDQIRQIELSRKTGEKTILEKADGAWRITSPVQLRADRDTVSTLAFTVSSLNSDRVVEEKAEDFAAYGLADPEFAVAVTGLDGKVTKAMIGDETPTGTGYFARLDGDPRVFTIATYTKSSLDKTHQDLRDKRLLTFDRDKLSRVELSAKGQAIEFGKNNRNEWQILKPRPLRADGGHVEELVRRLQDAKMDTGLSEEEARKAPAQFAGGTRVAVVKVTDAAGTQEMEVRKRGEDYYARGTAVEGVHKLSTDIGQGLDKGLDDFRNRKLFDFGFADVDRLEVRDGDKTYAFRKSGEKWLAGEKQMDSISVQNAIDKLRDLSAAKFVEKAFPANAVLDLTAIWEEGKQTDRVRIAKDGSAFVAIRDGEPSVYEVPAAEVEAIQQAVADVKEPPPPEKDAKK